MYKLSISKISKLDLVKMIKKKLRYKQTMKSSLDLCYTSCHRILVVLSQTKLIYKFQSLE